MERKPWHLAFGWGGECQGSAVLGLPRVEDSVANLSEHLTQLKPDAVSNSGDSLSLGPGAETAETRKPLLW